METACHVRLYLVNTKLYNGEQDWYFIHYHIHVEGKFSKLVNHKNISELKSNRTLAPPVEHM